MMRAISDSMIMPVGQPELRLKTATKTVKYGQCSLVFACHFDKIHKKVNDSGVLVGHSSHWEDKGHCWILPNNIGMSLLFMLASCLLASDNDVWC